MSLFCAPSWPTNIPHSRCSSVLSFGCLCEQPRDGGLLYALSSRVCAVLASIFPDRLQLGRVEDGFGSVAQDVPLQALGVTKEGAREPPI